MIRLRLFPALLLALLLANCSSTQSVTVADATPTMEAEATEAVPVIENVDGTADHDWYHEDAALTPYPGVGTDRAYQFLEGRSPEQTVVVAVIDSGIDIEHEDLRDVLWVNEDEVAGNGVDDDGNGYVDDLHGWSFLGNSSGENVHYDTMELTRIYVRLRDMYADVDPNSLPTAKLPEYEYWQYIKGEFEQARNEAASQLPNIQGLNQAVQQAQALLSEKLGKDDFTRDEVMGLDGSDPAVGQAQQVMQFLYANDIGIQDLKDYTEYLEVSLNYRYNPDFDPRDIVGDDYSDLSERIYGNDDVAGPDPSHGTHVAGIIGAVRDNDMGAEGVADNVRIMVLRAVPDGDERDKDVANAIRYAADNGAHIINMSFGKGYSPDKAVVDEAIRYASDQGVLLVHAAGNDGKSIDENDNFPTDEAEAMPDAPNWLSVGAITWTKDANLPATFSNYGADDVDLFAPGQDIYSTLPGDEYGNNQGTSMAAPVVSGVAALVLSYFPDITATQLKTLLLESVTPYQGTMVVKPGTENDLVDFGTLSRTGGVVNAYQAVRRAAEMTN